MATVFHHAEPELQVKPHNSPRFAYETSFFLAISSIHSCASFAENGRYSRLFWVIADIRSDNSSEAAHRNLSGGITIRSTRLIISRALVAPWRNGFCPVEH